MIVLKWFHSVLGHIEKDDVYKDTVNNFIMISIITFKFVQKCDRHTRALILAIAVCYYAKLQFREDFEQYVAPLLIRNTPNAPIIFREEIIRYLISFS